MKYKQTMKKPKNWRNKKLVVFFSEKVKKIYKPLAN